MKTLLLSSAALTAWVVLSQPSFAQVAHLSGPKPAPDAERYLHAPDGAVARGLAAISLDKQAEAPSPITLASHDCGHQPCDSCRSCHDCKIHYFAEHRCGGFFDWLFMHANNADLAYGIPVDGTASSAVPTGPIGVADPEHESGFRVGFNWAISPESSVRGTYTFFESDIFDDITAPSGDVIRALLTHPNTSNAAADSLTASASYDIDLDMVDLDFRGLLFGGCDYSVNVIAGVRYARLDQDLLATYTILGTTTVDSTVDFEGIGPRIGLEAEKLLKHGFLVYGRGAANFLIGDFNADYQQTNIFAGTLATTSLKDDRIVPVLELELGVGWQNKSGCFRILAGYLVSGWFNTMTNSTWIEAVQSSSFSQVDETLAFDGLTIRTEVRF